MERREFKSVSPYEATLVHTPEMAIRYYCDGKEVQFMRSTMEVAADCVMVRFGDTQKRVYADVFLPAGIWNGIAARRGDTLRVEGTAVSEYNGSNTYGPYKVLRFARNDWEVFVEKSTETRAWPKAVPPSEPSELSVEDKLAQIG